MWFLKGDPTVVALRVAALGLLGIGVIIAVATTFLT